MTDHVPAPEQQGESEEAEARAEADRRFPRESFQDADRAWQMDTARQVFASGARWQREREAAIRAPLEERIRELEEELNGTVESYVTTTSDMGAEVLELRAENAKLREALDKVMLAWYSHSGGDDFVDLVGYHIPEIERALTDTAGAPAQEGD